MTASLEPWDLPPRRTSPKRHPLEILASLPANPPATLSEVPAERILIQDSRPLSESLEWLLSTRSWRTGGLDSFVRGEVPYVVNNVAWVADSLAATILASLGEITRPERIRILELGAGLGLFARQFLDAFRDLCRRQERDEYDRLTYFVTDGSERTVQRWIDSSLFGDHDRRVEIGTCDARDPRRIFGAIAAGGNAQSVDLPTSSFHLVIANYLLDSLPATIVCRGPDSQLEEMRVRTYLEPEARTEITRRFHLEIDEILRLVQVLEAGSSEEPECEASVNALLRVLPYFSYEVAFERLTRSPRHLDQLETLDSVTGRMVLNDGAIDCLDGSLELLRDEGLIFYRDLGAVRPESMAERSYSARFGSTVVATVNFPLLDGRLRSRGLKVISPADDELRAIHTRLAIRGSLPRTEQVFGARFDQDSYGMAESAAGEAMKYIHTSQFEPALASYRKALELCPTDWQLLGQVAQFLTQQMLRAPEALELVEQALQINPAFSAFLWNTLGNCHYVLGDVESAHRAYLRAHEIDSHDVQAHLNLAYTQASLGAFEEALLAVARGLACDPDGRFEPSLLAKQTEILARLEQRRREDSERSAARDRAFSSLP